jgi:hypothetical protein
MSYAAQIESLNILKVSWFSRDRLRLRRSVGSLSLRRPGFDPRPFHVRFVTHIIAAGIRFSLSITPPKLHTYLKLRIALTSGKKQGKLKVS